MVKKVYKELVLGFSFIALFFGVAGAQECHLGHTANGTAYGEVGVKQYASVKHGPDGALFLDPYFLSFIETMANERVLDAGCGAAPWAIHAAIHEAYVWGIDIQPSMIEKGKEEVLKSGLADRIVLEVGSVNQLPYENAFFDKAISINVGCNLPSMKIVGNELEKVGLSVHLTELARVLKENGRVVVTAPASFDIVFTSGRRPLVEIMQDIEEVLSKIDGEDPNSIVKYLSTLSDVYRATFVNVDGKLKLITDVNDLKEGDNIWRKLPGLAVPNFYHSENEYVNEAIKAEFSIVKIEKPKFSCEAKFRQYNDKHPGEFQVGEAYINHNAFMMIELEKLPSLTE